LECVSKSIGDPQEILTLIGIGIGAVGAVKRTGTSISLIKKI